MEILQILATPPGTFAGILKFLGNFLKLFCLSVFGLEFQFFTHMSKKGLIEHFVLLVFRKKECQHNLVFDFDISNWWQQNSFIQPNQTLITYQWSLGDGDIWLLETSLALSQTCCWRLLEVKAELDKLELLARPIYKALSPSRLFLCLFSIKGYWINEMVHVFSSSTTIYKSEGHSDILW